MSTTYTTTPVDAATAHSLHFIVKSLHDGECPRCYELFDARSMVPGTQFGVVKADSDGYTCPRCRFRVTGEEVEAAIDAYAPAMAAELEIFEAWRQGRMG